MLKEASTGPLYNAVQEYKQSGPKCRLLHPVLYKLCKMVDVYNTVPDVLVSYHAKEQNWLQEYKPLLQFSRFQMKRAASVCSCQPLFQTVGSTSTILSLLDFMVKS